MTKKWVLKRTETPREGVTTQVWKWRDYEVRITEAPIWKDLAVSFSRYFGRQRSDLGVDRASNVEEALTVAEERLGLKKPS